LDVPPDLIRAGLAAFNGVERRFHIRGEKNGVMVLDDYGHHPTEIQVTLQAAKAGWDRRLLVLFQPHRYSRTKGLLEEFSHVFSQADKVFVTEIYPAGEQPIPGVSGAGLTEKIRQAGHPAVLYIEHKEALLDEVIPQLQEGDMVLTLGAGDIWKVGVELLERL
jgi:UDP-N-acetylmuramate--alanine ligase